MPVGGLDPALSRHFDVIDFLVRVGFPAWVPIQNEYDFMLVLDFEVTAEMIGTAFFLLDRFVLDSRNR